MTHQHRDPLHHPPLRPRLTPLCLRRGLCRHPLYLGPLRLFFAICLFSLFSLLTLVSYPSVSAYVDLVSPANGAMTKTQNATFEYYLGLPGVQSCTLSVGTQIFTDTTITNNAFNTFSVVNIPEGSHPWRISCTDGETIDYSVIRQLIIDRTAPSVTILSPVEGSTVPSATLILIAEDDHAEQLTCMVSANGFPLAAAPAPNGLPVTLNLTLPNGPVTLMVRCTDNASNTGEAQRNFTLEAPPPPLFLDLATNKPSYALGEQVLLTLDSLTGANVSLEICPDRQGFVQCYTPLVGDTFPQTLILPYTNQTGSYLVEAVAIHGNRSAMKSAAYLVENTLRITISPDQEPRLNEPITYTAHAAGGIGTITYAWNLSNGSAATGPSVTRTYAGIGSFTERVTVTDAAGNNATAAYTVTVEPEHLVTVTVTDARTKTALADVAVQVQHVSDNHDAKTRLTGSDGVAAFTVRHATYKLFLSKEGYSYLLEERAIEKEENLAYALEPYDHEKPRVTILSPSDGATVSLPVTIAYTADDAGAVSCTLSYGKSGSEWLQNGGTRTIQPGAEEGFELLSLEEGSYSYVVECADQSGNIGESERRAFTVVAASAILPKETTAPLLTGFGDDPLAVVDRAYGAYDAFDAEQRSVAELLGWERMINERKREIQRLARDLDALRFRRDLSEDERRLKEQELRSKVKESERTLPLDLVILESDTSVVYLKEEGLRSLAPAIGRQKAYAFTDQKLVAYLHKVQQEFAPERKLIRAKLLLADGSSRTISIVSHTIRYKAGEGQGATGSDSSASFSAPSSGSSASSTGASPDGSIASRDATAALDGTYTLYEAIPESVASSTKLIVTKHEHRVLSANGEPLALEFPPERRITYYVEGDVPLEKLSGIATVLLRKPGLDEISGRVTFISLAGVDWKLSLLLSGALILFVWLLRRGPIHRITYVFYAFSGKRMVHAVRMLVSDGLAHLDVNDLDRAVMRYKEAKLTYERLSDYAKNEVYDDLTRLRHALDSGYYSQLVQRIGAAISEGRLHDAIDDYARLEGTFERLDEEEQERLIIVAAELSRRITSLESRAGTSSDPAVVSGARVIVRNGAENPVGRGASNVTVGGGAP